MCLSFLACKNSEEKTVCSTTLVIVFGGRVLEADKSKTGLDCDLLFFCPQVITNNKQCTPEPVTVCTDAVTILYDLHTVAITAKEVDGGVTVTVDKERVDIFPYRNPWLSLEQPDLTQVPHHLFPSLSNLCGLCRWVGHCILKPCVIVCYVLLFLSFLIQHAVIFFLPS